jgi:signal transduction histidine kinase
MKMADIERDLPAAEEDETLAQLHRLLGQLKETAAVGETAWELGIHVDSLGESLKESAARRRGLEEENRQLQERLSREHRDYAELRASMDELLNLHELTETISSSFAIQDILAALMDLSGRFLPYEGCGVFALGQEGQTLEAMAARGDGRTEERVRAQWEDGIIDWVLRERRPVVIEDMETVEQPGVEECCTVLAPLSVRGKEIGIYALYCRRPKDEFNSGEMDLLGVLSNQTAIAIENARLYSDLEATNSQLKDSQHQLLTAAKMAAIGELAGGVAHEVNNPLQIILSRVQLMRMQNREATKVVQGLDLVEHNVRRISKIIRALLGFAGNNAQDGEWGECDIGQALVQAMELVQHQLDKGLIETEFVCGESLPLIEGNTGELEQVFINLIINAQNAMPKGGRLKVSVQEVGNTIEVRFADTGVGIAPELLERIFAPFFTTRSDEGGTGLGLAVSYGIIERHQGEITVESTVGEGTTFILRLPIATADGKDTT